MLWALFVILLGVWFLAVVSSYTMGGFVHVLLGLAVAALALQLFTGRHETARNGRSKNRENIGEKHYMDEDRIKNKAEELAAKIKEKASEAAESAEPAKSKARDLLGKLKDAGRQAAEKARSGKTETQPSEDESRDRDRNKDTPESDEEEVA